jgi:hypothetical protein
VEIRVSQLSKEPRVFIEKLCTRRMITAASPALESVISPATETTPSKQRFYKEKIKNQIGRKGMYVSL